MAKCSNISWTGPFIKIYKYMNSLIRVLEASRSESGSPADVLSGEDCSVSVVVLSCVLV